MRISDTLSKEGASELGFRSYFHILVSVLQLVGSSAIFHLLLFVLQLVGGYHSRNASELGLQSYCPHSDVRSIACWTVILVLSIVRSTRAPNPDFQRY